MSRLSYPDSRTDRCTPFMARFAGESKSPIFLPVFLLDERNSLQ